MSEFKKQNRRHTFRLLFVFVGCILIIILLLSSYVLWMKSPGIHLLGPIGQINLSSDCYVFDKEHDDTQMIPVCIRGKVHFELFNMEAGKFTGVISIDGLGSNTDQYGIHEHTIRSDENGMFHLMYYDNFYDYNEKGEFVSLV